MAFRGLFLVDEWKVKTTIAILKLKELKKLSLLLRVNSKKGHFIHRLESKRHSPKLWMVGSLCFVVPLCTGIVKLPPEHLSEKVSVQVPASHIWAIGFKRPWRILNIFFILYSWFGVKIESKTGIKSSGIFHEFSFFCLGREGVNKNWF